jgi:4-amino-4-deoxy-L-arabinose transferase-like glycosyltransferase
MLEIKKHKGIFAVCALYGIISIALFIGMTGGNVIMGGDSASYIIPAKNILSNSFFSNDGIKAAYIRTPGYPLFLAAIYSLGGNDTVVIIVQILLMTLKVYLFYQILVIMRTPNKLSLFGTGLLLCNIQSYGYSLSIMTEPLFGFFLMLALYFLVKYIYKGKNQWVFFAFSASLNYALLIRPILMYFNMLVCFALLVIFIINKTQFKCFLYFSLCFLVIFGGWSCRNYIHSGVFIFSTISKNNMKNHYAPIISAGSEYVKNHDVQGFIEGATDYHNEMFLQEYPEAETGGLNEAEISILMGKYGSRFIRTHFAGYIKVNTMGFLKMMFTPFQTTLLFESTTMSKKAMFVKGAQLLYFVYIVTIYALYLFGLAAGVRKRDVIQISIFLISGYLAVSGAIFATVRFRDPFFPLLLLSAVSNSGVIMQQISRGLNIPILKLDLAPFGRQKNKHGIHTRKKI